MSGSLSRASQSGGGDDQLPFGATLERPAGMTGCLSRASQSGGGEGRLPYGGQCQGGGRNVRPLSKEGQSKGQGVGVDPPGPSPFTFYL